MPKSSQRKEQGQGFSRGKQARAQRGSPGLSESETERRKCVERQQRDKAQKKARQLFSPESSQTGKERQESELKGACDCRCASNREGWRAKKQRRRVELSVDEARWGMNKKSDSERMVRADLHAASQVKRQGAGSAESVASPSNGYTSEL